MMVKVTGYFVLFTELELAQADTPEKLRQLIDEKVETARRVLYDTATAARERPFRPEGE